MNFIKLTLLCFLLSGQLMAQSNDPVDQDDGSAGSGGWSYIGDDRQVGIGIDDDGDLLGDFFFLLTEDEDSSWLGEGWIADGGAGGLKLNYHFVSGDFDPARPDQVPANVAVQKLFLAVDQNEEDDRKASLGWGMEKASWFANIQGSVGLTDERLVNRVTSAFSYTETGVMNGREFIQDFTTTTVTDWWEQAYDYGVGLRVGRWLDESLWRLTGGLDYEWGDYSSDQFTASMNVRKYFTNSPHSLGLNVEYFDRGGDFEFRESSDFRGFLVYRYDFGKNSRPSTVTERVQVPPENLQTTRKEQRLVKNEISVANNVFFELDRAEIRPSDADTWAYIARLIDEAEIVGDILVIGNTCDLGSVPYNQRLSERRADAVRAELIRLGIDGGQINTRGDGELNPRYPNDGETNRSRNRRVDIQFLTIQDAYEEVDVEVPADVRYETRVIPAEPAWLRRALRNPALHKRAVDTYQFQTSQSETEAGDITFLNGPPVATDDSLSVQEGGGATVIDVLANDSDPDGDALTITTTTQPQNGTVENSGVDVSYTPDPGFFGADSFTYTIDDGNGLTATATVTILVAEQPNRAPVAVDDFATTSKDTEVIIDVLANDSDPDGDPLSVVEVIHTTKGFARILGDGTILYTPMPGWWGGDMLTYTISDPDGLTATATITLDVTED